MFTPPPSDIISALDSEDPDRWWSQFLDEYSSQIFAVVRHFESDPDNASDCFQFVCEQLVANRFRRLRKFKVNGPAKFSTWLRAVVRNLCLDWHRKKFGRQRTLRSISRLSLFDQEVFRFIYERATTADDCLPMISARFPNTTAARIEESRKRIEAVLTVNQRWLVTRRAHAGNGNELASLDQPESFLSELEDTHPDPETQAITNERLRNLQRAMAQLTPNERLLIRLRFEEGLTLEKAAELLSLGNAQKADRQIREIIERLTKMMS